MANRLRLRVFVASAVKGERTAVLSSVHLTKAVQSLLEEHAPKLLENLESEDGFRLKVPGRQKLLHALREVNRRLLCSVVPIVAIQPNIDVELYFSDSVITNAFKNERVKAWKESDFCTRSGGATLEYGAEWAILDRIITELGAEVCYTPLEEYEMKKLLLEVREFV